MPQLRFIQEVLPSSGEDYFCVDCFVLGFLLHQATKGERNGCDASNGNRWPKITSKTGFAPILAQACCITSMLRNSK